MLHYKLGFHSPYGIARLFHHYLWYRNASGDLFEIKRHKTEDGIHWTCDGYFFFSWQNVKRYVLQGIPGKHMWEFSPGERPV
jgi:hypothetical protein